MTSASIPSAASRSAAVSASPTSRDRATIVTSRPRRRTWARPNGTGSGVSGTDSRRKYSDLFSTNTTGLGSAMAECSSPAASAAVAGMTTLSPGM